MRRSREWRKFFYRRWIKIFYMNTFAVAEDFFGNISVGDTFRMINILFKFRRKLETTFYRRKFAWKGMKSGTIYIITLWCKRIFLVSSTYQLSKYFMNSNPFLNFSHKLKLGSSFVRLSVCTISTDWPMKSRSKSYRASIALHFIVNTWWNTPTQE